MASLYKQLRHLVNNAAGPEAITAVTAVETFKNPTPPVVRFDTVMQGITSDPNRVLRNIEGALRSAAIQDSPINHLRLLLPHAFNGNTHLGSTRMAHNTPQPRFTR